MKLTFNKSFYEANTSKARYRVMLGSAGSGKSYNVAQDFILKLSQREGNNLLVIRASENSHLNSTFAELVGAINRAGLGNAYRLRTAPLSIVNEANGNSILFRGCNDLRAIERLKSVTAPNGKITWVWIEEATEIQASHFEIIDDRLRGILPEELYYQITLTFNPVNSKHWIKSNLWDYESTDIFKHKSTYENNAFIDEAYHKRMARRKEVDPEGYRIYGLGEWGEIGGLIFPNITIGSYNSTDFDKLSMGTDFGFNHKNATLLLGEKDGNIYVLKEWVSTGNTTTENIQMLIKGNAPLNVLMYCDSAEPDRIKDYKKAGYRALPVVKEVNSVSQQISWLQNARIYIDGSCLETIKELQQYKWKQDTKTGEYIDEPVSFNDDCVAAIRYGVEPFRKVTRVQSMSKNKLSL